MADGEKAPVVSLADRRAEKAIEAKDWTPRDALMQLVKEIDEGKVVNRVVIFHANVHDGICMTGYTASSPDVHCTMGLVEAGRGLLMYDMHEQMREAGG